MKTFKEFMAERPKMPIALQGGFHPVIQPGPSKTTTQPQVTNKQIIPPAEKLYQRNELTPMLLAPQKSAVKVQTKPPAD